MVSSFCLAHWVQFHRGPPVWCGDSGYIKQTGHLECGTRTWSPWEIAFVLGLTLVLKGLISMCRGLQTLPGPTFHLGSQKRQSALKLFPEFPREIWTRADIKAVKICPCRSVKIMLKMMSYGDWRSRGQVPVPQQVLMSLLWGSDLSSLPAATSAPIAEHSKQQ